MGALGPLRGSPIVARRSAPDPLYGMNELERLQAWYLAQCDGEWEHSFGVSIDTLDNPGWIVDIDLTGTSIASRLFAAVARGMAPNETDWVSCKVEGAKFQGAGGASNLVEILGIFLDWAEQS